jgi:hypothetical protein
MELADVERALKRPGEYLFEDGLWEIVLGLWIGLTMALPQLAGGAVAAWAPVVWLLTGTLGLAPAVRAAKARWVYPRTGHVTYRGVEPPESRISLGLSPASTPIAVLPEEGRRLARLMPLLPSLLGLVPFALIPAWFLWSMGDPRSARAAARLDIVDAACHVAIGFVLGALLLLAAWRWRQRRWLALGAVLASLGLVVGLSGLSRLQAVGLHGAGISAALLTSGTAAFIRYHRRTAGPSASDGA